MSPAVDFNCLVWISFVIFYFLNFIVFIRVCLETAYLTEIEDFLLKIENFLLKVP